MSFGSPWGAPWDSPWASPWLHARAGATVPNATVEVTAGTVAGNLSAIESIDGVDYTITEETATPGFDVVITLKNITESVGALVLVGYYDGNVGHTLNINAWDYNTSSYDLLGTLPDATADTWYAFTLIDADHRSGEEVKIQLIHPDPGNITHALHIDYLAALPSAALGSNLDFHYPFNSGHLVTAGV